jgi:hypothetical protein
VNTAIIAINLLAIVDDDDALFPLASGSISENCEAHIQRSSGNMEELMAPLH